MSTTSINPRPRSNARTHVDPKQCIGITGDRSIGSSCKRLTVWRIVGVGNFCNFCFDSFFAANWRRVDISQVKRLSDLEEDFFGGNERRR